MTTSLGAANGADRIRMLDGEGIDITLLYPTLGIQWSPSSTTTSSPPPTPAPTTPGSPTSANPTQTAWSPWPMSSPRTSRRERRSWSGPRGLGPGAAWSAAGPSTASPTETPTMTPSGPAPRSPAYPWPSTSWATPSTSATTCTPTQVLKSPGGASSPSAWRSLSA